MGHFVFSVLIMFDLFLHGFGTKFNFQQKTKAVTYMFGILDFVG